MLGHINDDGVVLVLLQLANPAFNSIADIKFQGLYHTTVDIGTCQNLKLVVETVAVGDDTYLTQIHFTTFIRLLILIVLDEHFHRRCINRLRVAQIAKGYTKSNNRGQNNPLPMENYDGPYV